MALIDDVRAVCTRLAPDGWGRLFAAHGLDIRATDLAAELARPLPAIRRKLEGFQDFSAEGTRGIEPGKPQHSLLYHALASPLVLNDDQGNRLGQFPTLRDLEIVEDYCFAAARRSPDDVRRLRGGKPLELVVFAVEYRPASETCSKLQADLVFSRMGVARVGTRPPVYRPDLRGFLPDRAEDPFQFAVLPARYAAYLAVRVNGDPLGFVPARFQDGDSALKFWQPVHKVFPGSECLVGLNISLTYSSSHVNEKIRRTHLALGEADPPVMPPYRFSRGIAELSTDPDAGRGLLAPQPHDRLVDEAALPDGTPARFRVPRNDNCAFAAYEPGPVGEFRPRPEYVHARTEVRDGKSFDLNNDPNHPDVLGRVSAGGYDALHYVDFTGDGFVEAGCPELAGQGLGDAPRAAYSLVTAPDFFPTCDQRELTEWTSSNAVPVKIREAIWPTLPETLCDQRLAANLQLPGNSFDPTEVTVSALVPLFDAVPAARVEPPPTDSLRHAHLPDDAAGVFAPGWDCTVDRVNVAGLGEVKHMAAYGLGSPFPEDSKLCSALSAFWPAVAPDSTRTMEPPPNPTLRSTTSPLTDEEIGRVGGLPWDGIPGPRVISVGGQEFVDCASFMHSDYVRSALNGKLTLRLTARVGAGEYETRALAMSLVYEALGGDRNDWVLLSFLKASPESPQSQQAQAEAQATLQEPIYFFDMFRFSSPAPAPDDFRRRRMPIIDRHTFYADAKNRRVLMKAPGSAAFQSVALAIT